MTLRKLTRRLTICARKAAHITARHLRSSTHKVVMVASIEAKLNRPSCSVLKLKKPTQKIMNLPSTMKMARLRYSRYLSTRFRSSVGRMAEFTFALRAKKPKPSRNLFTSTTSMWSSACVILRSAKWLCSVCTYRTTVSESSASPRWLSLHLMSCANNWPTTE